MLLLLLMHEHVLCLVLCRCQFSSSSSCSLETLTSLLHPLYSLTIFAQCHRITSHIHLNARRYQKYQTNQRQITEIPTERPCHHHRLTMSCQLNNMRLFFEFFFLSFLFVVHCSRHRRLCHATAILILLICNETVVITPAQCTEREKTERENNENTTTKNMIRLSG